LANTKHYTKYSAALHFLYNQIVYTSNFKQYLSDLKKLSCKDWPVEARSPSFCVILTAYFEGCIKCILCIIQSTTKIQSTKISDGGTELVWVHYEMQDEKYFFEIRNGLHKPKLPIMAVVVQCIAFRKSENIKIF